MKLMFAKSISAGVIAFASLGLALAACSDDNGTTTSSGGGGDGGSAGSGGGGGSSSRSDAYADALCGKIFECCGESEVSLLVDNIPLEDYAGCRILYRTIWDVAVEPVIAAGTANGRLEFDPAAFTACLDSMKGLSCSGFSPKSLTLCDGMLVPKVEKGGACANDAECTTNTCEIPDGSPEGTCIDAPAPVPEGQPCMDDDECVTGLYCDATTDTCATLKADGAACSRNNECQNVCVGEMFGVMGTCDTICQGGGPGPGPVDSLLETVGAPIAFTQCSRIFDCCTNDERAAVLFPGIDTEAECQTFSGILTAVGVMGLHNDVVGGLVSIDEAKFAACVEAYEATTCADFSKDDEFGCPDAIKGLVADGGACTDDRQCSSGSYCDESAGQDMGICAPLPAAGAACSTDCVDGYFCDMSACAAQKTAGEACNATSECAEGHCVADPANMKTCAIICDGI